MHTIDDILGREAIAALRRPVAEAGGLPGAAYTSEAFYKLEQQKLFPRTWTCAGFASDIPEPGDAMPVRVAGVPLILVRGKEGEVKAFHNVCRHRAALVLTAPCKGLKQFSCPYHAWAYDLDGRLKAAPYFDGTKDGRRGGLDFAKLGLIPARSATWHHWVFVNLAENAAPFAEHVRPLEELINGAEIAATRVGHREDWEFKANWKFQNDNWETYHHTWVHPNVFTKLSDDLDLATGEPKAAPIPLGTVVTLKRRAGTDFYPATGNDLPYIPFPEGRERVRCTSVLFPNMTLTLQSDHLSSVVTEPVAPDRTIAKMGYFFVGAAATGEAHAAGRKRVLDRWLGPTRRQADIGGIRSQDMLIWEQQQIARHSPVADQVVFSPVWEQNIHHFQNMLIDVMTAPSN